MFLQFCRGYEINPPLPPLPGRADARLPAPTRRRGVQSAAVRLARVGVQLCRRLFFHVARRDVLLRQ